MSKKISELPELPASPAPDGTEVVPVNKGGVTYKSTLGTLLGWLKPMTTLGDMIVGGASGVASRLGIGTSGQILTVVSGQPSWQPAPASGFTNPMTTEGDLIRGGTAGAAQRLAVGTEHQVLTVNAGGVPVWADNSGSGGITAPSVNYMYNPNVLTGDPGSQRLGVDTGVPSTATKIYVSDLTKNGTDVDSLLDLIRVGDAILIYGRYDTTVFARYNVTVNAIDSGSWHEIGVSYVAGSGTELADFADVMLSVTQSGTPGMSNPMTTAGDLIVGGASGAPGRLGVGSNGQVLTVTAGVPAWGASGGALTNFTEALNTSSPNNTINVASFSVNTGVGTTNVGIALVPKGNGGISMRVPDGTATGGNARGQQSIDFQSIRSSASQVTSGTNAALMAIVNSTVSGNQSAAIAGIANTVSGSNSGTFAASTCLVSSGSNGAIIGSSGSTINLNNTVVLASSNALAQNANTIVQATGQFANVGDAQVERTVLNILTTNATPVNSSNLSVRSSATYAVTVHAVAVYAGGNDNAMFTLKFLVQNIGVTQILGVPVMVRDVWTTGAADPTTWTLAPFVTGGNTQFYLRATGAAIGAVRWVCSLEMVECVST